MQERKIMEKNENVEMITGDPKKAINKLSLPIIASMLLIFMKTVAISLHLFWMLVICVFSIYIFKYYFLDLFQNTTC